VVLLDPCLVVAELIQPLHQVEVALQRQGWVLSSRMKRRQEDAKAHGRIAAGTHGPHVHRKLPPSGLYEILAGNLNPDARIRRRALPRYSRWKGRGMQKLRANALLPQRSLLEAPTVSTVAAAVLAANGAFYAAFAAMDYPAMESVWARTAELTCIHPGWNVLSGRAPVLESWEAILLNPSQPRIVSGGATVQLFGECAVVICRELVAGNPLTATNVFVREAGRWRLVHHHSGPVANTG
jgi:ketosteroid isomerase-like protein